MANQLFINVLFILNGFILGSLPFGYIITKLSKSKDIMEIGWKKNSSSNVMKNIGKAEGILTFALDFAKGFLAVYIATLAGCPFFIQALCGAFAVTGHNWSPFLGFKGGRGIATLGGALFSMSPLLTLLLIGVCAIFTALWTASIGTIIAIMLGITISFANTNFWGIFLLLLFSIIPVFLKRLSPIKDIIPFIENKDLIENRIIFDQDEVPPFRKKLKAVIENNISNTGNIDGDFDFINTKNNNTTIKEPVKPTIIKKTKTSQTKNKIKKSPIIESKNKKEIVNKKTKITKKPAIKTIAKKETASTKKTISPAKTIKKTTPTTKAKTITTKNPTPITKKPNLIQAKKTTTKTATKSKAKK